MSRLLDDLIHVGRVAYEGTMFVLLIPFYLFHETAHAAAALPWGGPTAVYLIFDRSGRGVLARIPAGAAILHDPYDEPVPDVVVALAPLALIAPGYTFVQSPSLAISLMGGAVFFAGLGGVADLLHVLVPDFYEDLLIGSDFEYVRVVDFTILSAAGEAAPARASRDELED